MADLRFSLPDIHSLYSGRLRCLSFGAKPSRLLAVVAAIAFAGSLSGVEAKEKPRCSIEGGETVQHGTYKDRQVCDYGSWIPIEEWADMQLAKEEKWSKYDPFFQDLDKICAKAKCSFAR